MLMTYLIMATLIYLFSDSEIAKQRIAVRGHDELQTLRIHKTSSKRGSNRK